MKRIGRICKAASLLAMVATAALSCKTEQENAIGLIIGTYGNHLYHYGFDPDDGSFTFEGKAEALNPSYVLGHGTQDGGMEVFAVSEAGAESGVYSFSYIQSNGAGSETSDASRNTDRCPCTGYTKNVGKISDASINPDKCQCSGYTKDVGKTSDASINTDRCQCAEHTKDVGKISDASINTDRCQCTGHTKDVGKTSDVSKNPDRCQCAKHPDKIMMTADLRQTGASPCFLLVLNDLPFTCNKDTAFNQRKKTSAPSQGKEQGEKDTDTNQGKECGCETLGQTDPKHPNAAGHFLMTADYTGGSVSVFPIKDGRLDSLCCQLKFEGNGPVVKRQQSSHIHQLRELPEIKGVQGKYILATDLGADALRLLKVIPGCDKPLQTGTQTPGCTNTPGSFCPIVHMTDIPCPAGSGPRHMEFSKDHKTLYCIAELSGDVLVYSISEKQGEPAFEMIQKIQADEVNAGGSADIHLHPSGKYLYTSHRLDNDGIAIFRTNDDGTLEKIGYTRTARHPRNFMITEDGRHLLVACRDDQVIQTFTIGKDGSLTLLPQVLRFENDKPSSITAIQR